jgi:hypothetical protein
VRGSPGVAGDADLFAWAAALEDASAADLGRPSVGPIALERPICEAPGNLRYLGVTSIRAVLPCARPQADRPEARVPPGFAFSCAKCGVHHSLPAYSGGLGALAGELVEEVLGSGCLAIPPPPA